MPIESRRADSFRPAALILHFGDVEYATTYTKSYLQFLMPYNELAILLFCQSELCWHLGFMPAPSADSRPLPRQPSSSAGALTLPSHSTARFRSSDGSSSPHWHSSRPFRSPSVPSACTSSGRSRICTCSSEVPRSFGRAKTANLWRDFRVDIQMDASAGGTVKCGLIIAFSHKIGADPSIPPGLQGSLSCRPAG